MPSHPVLPIAYFSMEIGLKASLPTYSGGLGVLAGDTLKSCADLGLPVTGVTLLYRKGYFTQSLSDKGQQMAHPVLWNVEEELKPLSARTEVKIEGRSVKLRAFRYDLKGVGGHIVPIYFLDSDLLENDPKDRSLTDHLYGGDHRYRLAQEVILGMGGVGMLKALDQNPAEGPSEGIGTYHMNEGHAALLSVALLDHKTNGQLEHASQKELDWVRDRVVFTTHTPVPAGHDRFDLELTEQVLGTPLTHALKNLEWIDDQLNMTHLALKSSRYVNGVANRHGEVSRQMFPGYPIDAITNGIHARSWTAKSMAMLFDECIPHWQKDNYDLRLAIELPLLKLEAAHQEAKNDLLSAIKERTGQVFDPQVFTLGFARRAATYKRGDLLLSNPDALKAIAAKHGGLQIVYAGKSHPKDDQGIKVIERIVKAGQSLSEDPNSKIKVVYLENYDMDLGHLICAGVDLWINNPIKPLEASGTSGMKAALNGVPNLSTLDGWWVEGCFEGVTGWEIEDQVDGMNLPPDLDLSTVAQEAFRSLTHKLDQIILPLFHQNKPQWLRIMRQAIAINGAHFTTQRMMHQYLLRAYPVPFC